MGTGSEEELLWHRGRDDCSYLELHMSFIETAISYSVLAVAMASGTLGQLGYEHGGL